MMLRMQCRMRRYTFAYFHEFDTYGPERDSRISIMRISAFSFDLITYFDFLLSNCHYAAPSRYTPENSHLITSRALMFSLYIL